MRERRRGHSINLAQANLQALSGNGIMAVQVNAGTGQWITIWGNGAPVAPAVSIPDGKSWELRVRFGASSTAGLWGSSITVVALEAQPEYQKQSQNTRYLTAGSITDEVDFNMGPMPESNVSLRIKHWVTDYYTQNPPPDVSPTNW